MKKEIILRENHKDCLNKEIGKSYKIYTDHFSEITKDFNFIDDLLKDINGKITLKKVNDSWFNYHIEIIYKDHIFEVGRDWKNKLQIHFKELYKYYNSTIYNKEKEEFIKNNKPLNYTFYKLTTKKLIQVLDYKIKLLKLLKKLDHKKENNSLKTYEEYKKKLEFIAKTFKKELKFREDNHGKNHFLYAPFGLIQVTYEYTTKNVKFDYNIDTYIDMIKTIKEG